MAIQTILKQMGTAVTAILSIIVISFFCSCSKSVSQSDYISFDTLQGQLTDRSSMGIIEIVLNGSGANYSYYIAEGAKLEGDLTAGNKVEVVLGTPQKEKDRKLVVAFRNTDDNFTRCLKSVKGLWMRQEVSQNGGKQASLELMSLNNISCTNLPVCYRSWEVVSDILVLLHKADGSCDTAVIDRSIDPEKMLIRPIGIVLEKKD